MANSITIPAPADSVLLVPAGNAPRAQFVYADGKRTDVPRTNPQGQPLYGFDALAQFDGLDLGTVRVVSPAETLPALGFGSVLHGVGSAVLTVANQRDAFDLRITVVLDGIEAQAPSRKGGE
ncbi:hypothetical protein PFZ49_01105 [Microbacterium lacticum]|uniref:hypothetical protein n=1 Tax=Microbacterium lacticum TaxID=33885 RepID=UPI003A8639D1